jgi:hypothetical protein
MSNAEARAWWDEVQHLRPDADRDAPRPPRAASVRPRPAADDLPSADELDAWLAAESPRRFPSRDEPDDRASHEAADDEADVVAQPAEVVPVRPELVPDTRWQTDADGRRTVQITGQAARATRRVVRDLAERRPTRPLERLASTPDRVALWAVLLGLMLVVIAATTSNAQAAVL